MAAGQVTTPDISDKAYSLEGQNDNEQSTNGYKPQHPPIQPLQQSQWQSLFIPKILESKLIESEINSAQELVKLFHTEKDLKELLTDLFPKDKEEKGLNIIHRKKFITSVLEYYESMQSQRYASPKNSFSHSHNHNMAPGHVHQHVQQPSNQMHQYTQQEAEALAKLNNQTKSNRQYVQEIETEKQNIYTLCEAADKSMTENLEALKQKINEFETNFKDKLLEIKKYKLNTLDEKATEINDYQQQIEQCRTRLNANISSNSFAGDVDQRMVTNINMVNMTLRQKISPFTKTAVIEGIANEQKTVTQALELMRTDCEEDPERLPPVPLESHIPSNLEATNDGSGCSIVPQQVGNNCIELFIGLNISYDIPEDDSKEDAIIYQLEMHHKKKNQWKTVSTLTSNDPTTRFELKGLKKQAYSVRIKYYYKLNGYKQEKYSSVQVISLGTAVVWNATYHGTNVSFPEKHKLKCKSGCGPCSMAMDPMVINGTMFSRIMIGLEIHSYGAKSCFGFLDETKWKGLMNGLWNNCFLHCIRDNQQGVYGLSTFLNQQQIFYCNDGTYNQPIKVGRTRNGDKYIFEVVFGEQNYCNVYKNNVKNDSLLLSGNDKRTFTNIPSSIVFVYSHHDYGESEVSIKVMEVEFKK